MHNPDDEENSKSPNHPHHESMNTGVQSTVMDGWQLAHGGLNTMGEAAYLSKQFHPCWKGSSQDPDGQGKGQVMEPLKLTNPYITERPRTHCPQIHQQL